MATCGLSLLSLTPDIILSPMTELGWHNLSVELGPGSDWYDSFHGKPAPKPAVEKSRAIISHGTIRYFGGSMTKHMVAGKFYYQTNKMIVLKGG